MLASQVMALQMGMPAWTSMQAKHALATPDMPSSQSAMPCHEVAPAQESSTTSEAPACNVCGFCMMASVAIPLHAIQLPPLFLSQNAPTVLAQIVRSITLPPAIKPPILV